MTVEEIISAAEEGKRFAVDNRGIAYWFVAKETYYDEDYEWSGIAQPTGNVLMCMVGDDHLHTIDPDDVEVLNESYCLDCGQIGCPSNPSEV
jgi:hypothetical protein